MALAFAGLFVVDTATDKETRPESVNPKELDVAESVVERLGRP